MNGETEKDMTTLVKLGPTDHGRTMSLEEFQTVDYQEGYQYELIDGRLYVSPLPDLPQGRVEHWIFCKLLLYANAHPEILNFVYGKCRVFVPDRPGTTNPEPDVAAYNDFPLDLRAEEVAWQDVSPVLVVEVVSENDPDKDLVRNVELYGLVPSIKEYWIFDSREGVERPRLIVYRRGRGRKWRQFRYEPEARYTTPLLPDFELILHLRS
jgi:Uma2 family endonuclease